MKPEEGGSLHLKRTPGPINGPPGQAIVVRDDASKLPPHYFNFDGGAVFCAATSSLSRQSFGRSPVDSENSQSLIWPLIIKFPKTPPKSINILPTEQYEGHSVLLNFSVHTRYEEV
jgi:hypothetical protein